MDRQKVVKFTDDCIAQLCDADYLTLWRAFVLYQINPERERTVAFANEWKAYPYRVAAFYKTWEGLTTREKMHVLDILNVVTANLAKSACEALKYLARQETY